MKNKQKESRIYQMRRLSILVIFFILGAAAVSTAQTDPKAKAILAEVSKKYSALNTFRAEFTYSVNNPQAGINQTQSGTMYAQPKTNKYKVVLKNQELTSDGKNQWTYLKDEKEVQVNEVDNASNAINPARIFTIYQKGYKYIYTGNIKQNTRVYQVIDLSPVDSKQSFFKVRLTIDKVKKQITKAVIFDKNGSHYTYTVNALVPNVKLADSFFTFDAKKHPGVEVVDLR